MRAFYAALLEREFPYGCFAINTVREKHVVSRRAFTTVERFVASGEERFRRNLTAARKAGELPAGTDPDALAKLLTALNMGLVSYGIVEPDPTARGRILGVVEQLLGLGAIAPR